MFSNVIVNIGNVGYFTGFMIILCGNRAWSVYNSNSELTNLGESVSDAEIVSVMWQVWQPVRGHAGRGVAFPVVIPLLLKFQWCFMWFTNKTFFRILKQLRHLKFM